jgi:hypothetical protein
MGSHDVSCRDDHQGPSIAAVAAPLPPPTSTRNRPRSSETDNNSGL